MTEGHGGFDDAVDGIAKPRGGHDSPELHNDGDTESIFTSWSPDVSVADHFATRFGKPGVKLKADIPKSQLVESPDAHEEAEVLVTGVVVGAEVSGVKPR